MLYPGLYRWIWFWKGLGETVKPVSIGGDPIPGYKYYSYKLIGIDNFGEEAVFCSFLVVFMNGIGDNIPVGIMDKFPAVNETHIMPLIVAMLDRRF
jgi:hypothetical protein